MTSAIINLDLLSVGITVAATGILGFVVFFNNWRSVTNRAFLALSLVTIAWGVVNYLSYQTSSGALAIWLLRLVIFFAVWQAFFLYRLFDVFPAAQKEKPWEYKLILLPVVFIAAALTLTPLVLREVVQMSQTGRVEEVANGPAIAFFGMVSVGLVVLGMSRLFLKMRTATALERASSIWIWVGAFITFLLIITFNFVYPAFFNNARFIPLGSVFFFPFIAFTFYAIARHSLFEVKVIATELLAFSLAIVAIFEVVIAREPAVLAFRSGVFALTLAFGIMLIRSVMREVEQREKLEELTKKLEAANAKLEELSGFKTQLLSIASHQIRSPLAAIKGFVQLLVEGAYGPLGGDKIKETLGKVKRSADDLIDLINTLLDLRKVEEGRMEYQFSKTDMVSLVRDVVENLRPLATNKGLELTLKAPTGDIFVNADAQKLKQVVQNLIDNAIKYTPAGFVRVEVYAVSPSGVMVSVADSGLGIAPELLPHLFEEFIRDERVKKQILGTGLGLYIARKMVEAHGGKLWADSKGIEKGSTFFLTLRTLV